MDKPITVARQDFMESIIDLINHAQLPAFIIKGCIEEILPTLNQLAQDQYQADLKKYREEQEQKE